MILDITDLYNNFDTKVVPYIHGGVIIDTSVVDILFEGLVTSRITQKDSPELDKLLRFLELLKLSDKWDKFYITPHILTEVCTHLRNKYNKWQNYARVIEEVIPILKTMREPLPIKNIDLLNRIDLKNPVVEIGDISIFLTADSFVDKKENVAILADDFDLNNKYAYTPHVLILNYQNIILNSI